MISPEFSVPVPRNRLFDELSRIAEIDVLGDEGGLLFIHLRTISDGSEVGIGLQAFAEGDSGLKVWAVPVGCSAVAEIRAVCTRLGGVEWYPQHILSKEKLTWWERWSWKKYRQKFLYPSGQCE